MEIYIKRLRVLDVQLHLREHDVLLLDLRMESNLKHHIFPWRCSSFVGFKGEPTWFAESLIPGEPRRDVSIVLQLELLRQS